MDYGRGATTSTDTTEIRESGRRRGDLRRLAVTFDDQAFVLQERGGISRIFVELLRQFSTGDDNVDARLPVRFTHNAHLLDWMPDRFRAPPLGLGRQPLMRVANRAVSGRARPDILHSTYYFGDPPKAAGRKLFSTVYDMIPERFPQYFGGLNPHRNKRAYVSAADGIICISESAKSDLVRFFGAPAGGVFVVPIGVGDSFADPASPAFKPADQYLLFVGQRHLYKDFRTVVRAFGSVARTYPDLALVVAGGEPWSESDIEGLPHAVRSRVIHVRPPDRELPALYQHAAAFVTTSRWEGFGLPVLEALASGTPAVVSDIPSHREVADDAAIYFPAQDSDALAECLLRVLRDRAPGDVDAAAGQRRASQFTWRRTARLTADAYRSVL